MGFSCLKGFVNPSLEGRWLHFGVLHNPGSGGDGEVSAAGSAPMAQPGRLHVVPSCIQHVWDRVVTGVAALKSLIGLVFEKLL